MGPIKMSNVGTNVTKVKQWRDEGEIQNECDGPCYKVMLKVETNNCMRYLYEYV